MADSNEKRIKPQDMVTVFMANKHYKPGQKAEVHSAVAEKLIEAGKAFKTEKAALDAIEKRKAAPVKEEVK